MILFYFRAIEAINSLTTTFIKWPNASERKLLSQKFDDIYGFKDCVGIVDGTHIVLARRPSVCGEVYFTRKHRYSVSAQIVCDDQKRIIYFHHGWPGSVHDSVVYGDSELSKNPSKFLDEKEYIMGDSAYTLTNKMVTPYKGSCANLPENKKFNEALSSMRVLSEHTIGIVKGRWHSLTGKIIINC